MSKPPEFDWTDEITVVPEQPAIACYTNPNGAVVLRQAGQFGVDEDHWVYIHRHHIVAVVYALIDEAGLPMDIVKRPDRGYCDVDRPDARTERIEAARADVDWQAVHDEFDRIAEDEPKANETVTKDNQPRLFAAE